LQQHEVPAGPVLTLPELLTHPHLLARQMVIDLEHPAVGPIPGAKGFGMPIRFVEHPLQFDQPAPLLGAHNEEIYKNVLGVSDTALAELRAKGVI
jgi:crotonobetainyl-CoA:carnitine CoA-transferase CaiB-like acyl-CoA transferase